MDYAPTILSVGVSVCVGVSVGLDREIPSLRIFSSFVLRYWLLQYEMMKILKGLK